MVHLNIIIQHSHQSSINFYNGASTILNNVFNDFLKFYPWRYFFLFLPMVFFLCSQAASLSCYQRALILHGLTSALRLHQRMPPLQFTRVYLAQLLVEDSCHNLLYALVFINSYPLTCILSSLLCGTIARGGGGGGVLTPNFGRYVLRQSEKWARALERAPGQA